MPGQKRKASGSTCGCFKDHQTKAECERQAFLDERQALTEKHRAIAAQVIIYSETVEIFVGKEKETVNVHKDLLTLHSMYFTDLFNEKDSDADRKIEISAKPSLFADFISWVYTGEFLKVENNALAGETSVDDLWALGRFFRAPAFQNFCMDDCRSYCKASETDDMQPWPFIQGIKQMYSLTRPEAKLRKLAIHSLSYKNPLQENKKGSLAWKEWKSLLTAHVSEEDEPWLQEIQVDFVEEVGKDWDGIPPWDDRRRDDYMEKEISLEKRWEAQILAARTKAEIKRAALAKTDVRSIVEWAHLQRRKN